MTHRTASHNQYELSAACTPPRFSGKGGQQSCPPSLERKVSLHEGQPPSGDDGRPQNPFPPRNIASCGVDSGQKPARETDFRPGLYETAPLHGKRWATSCPPKESTRPRLRKGDLATKWIRIRSSGLFVWYHLVRDRILRGGVCPSGHGPSGPRKLKENEPFNINTRRFPVICDHVV